MFNLLTGCLLGFLSTLAIITAFEIDNAFAIFGISFVLGAIFVAMMMLINPDERR